MCWTLEQTDVIVFGCATKLLLFLDCCSKKRKKKGKSHFTQRLFLQLLCLLHLDSLMRAAERVSAVKTPRCNTIQCKCLLPKCVAPRLRKGWNVETSGGFLNCTAWRSPQPCPAGGMREHRQTSLKMSEEGRGFHGEPEVLRPEGDTWVLSRGVRGASGCWRTVDLKIKIATLRMPR